MESEHKSSSDRISQTSGGNHEQARSNLAQLSEMLEAEEARVVPSAETAEKLQAAGVKGMVAATVAASVMGITGMMQSEKAGEFTPPPNETTPVVSIVDIPQPVVEWEQKKEPVEERKMPFASAQVEFTERSWWHDVPTVSQQDLTYKGRETDYGCAPAAVSMVTEYWHQQDPSNKTSSAQELLDKNVEQGIFEGSGMSVTYLHDELAALGYEAKDYSNANLETLKQEVAKGPVVAAVKLNMRTDGTNHSVVVTGISENNEVRVNDPWTGESRMYSWETFNASWGTLGWWFTTVRPS